MKKKITIAVLGILLLGIVTAGIVYQASNSLVGNLKINAPVEESLVFYATTNLYLKDNLNEGDIEETYRGFNKEPGEKTFISEELNINEIPPSDYKIKVKLCVSDKPVSQDFTNIVAKLILLKGDIKNIICEGQINEILVQESCSWDSDYDVYEISCSKELLDLDSADKFLLNISNSDENELSYKIGVDGNTKIEITKNE